MSIIEDVYRRATIDLELTLTLPAAFCWTKFGVEAGEQTDSIFQRKECERIRNGGAFLWGIGNSIAPSMFELASRDPAPKVVFTPMLGPAATMDIRPNDISLWAGAEDMAGRPFAMPSYSVVTSGRSAALGRGHFALVCKSDALLYDPGRPEKHLDPDGLRNLRTGARLGASQVTSVVESYQPERHRRGRYRVAATATLTSPYLVRLIDPLPVPNALRPDLSTTQEWVEIVDQLIELRRRAGRRQDEQMALL
jgi:hypothetical protein